MTLMVAVCGQRLQIPGSIAARLLRRGSPPVPWGLAALAACPRPRGQTPAGRGRGREHLVLPGFLGASVPSTQLVLPRSRGTPRTMLKLRAPGEAPQRGLGHELTQQKALKMIRQKNQSLPAQTTATAQVLVFFFNC